ncbi:Fic family protein [Rhizobium tubonense]|uniref:Cell filamentation protein Fic n=1 Tax=Rhizobium tubonense TaxID=484088 RepID=A0A2W4CNX3_9HYPH|nr:Fic family protein [Rhizobium tubonense]PZM14081.1 cell filamentation protein Fic [Rhizobium tubonense]
MARFIYDRPNWPAFRWDSERLSPLLGAIRHRQGRLIGQMESLGFPLQTEAVMQTLTEDIIKSSEIEGEILDRQQVRSSVARRLGIEIAGLVPSDRDVDGIVELMLDATKNFRKPLDAERLFGWHVSLFPAGRSGMARIAAGAWRDDRAGPMQVISGAIGRERVHFQAPEAVRVRPEMQMFLDWFNAEGQVDAVLKAALAHLWFVTIHPFDDGNGRIARAIADMALARSEATSQRFYSMSAQIRIERKVYYDILERSQKGDLDVTEWLEWFLACLGRAFEGAETTLASIMVKARFWEKHEVTDFNARQRSMLNRLLDGFEGKLTTTKWATLQECSGDTALRDIDGLVAAGVLHREASGGRSTSYALRLAQTG